jgi:cell division protein FtsZ
MGIGIAEGDERAKEAAKRAVNSPLLDISITGAKGILFVVAGSDDLGIMEVQEAAKVVNESVDKNAKVIFGMMKDVRLKKGQIRIIVIATGFPEQAVHLAQEHSLFSLANDRRQEERGKIYHEVLKRPEPLTAGDAAPPDSIEKEEPMVTALPTKNIPEPIPPKVKEEDDSWGAIPAFLRRHRK